MITVRGEEKDTELIINYFYDNIPKSILTLIIRSKEVQIPLWCSVLTSRDIMKLENLIAGALKELNVKKSVVGVEVEKQLSEKQVRLVVELVKSFLENELSKPRKLKRLSKC